MRFTPKEKDTILTSILSVADILIHKVFRSIELVELEVPGTIIDTVNRMEKRGLIRRTEDVRQLNDLRNAILHEYEESHLVDLMKECLAKTRVLFEVLANVKKYCALKKLTE